MVFILRKPYCARAVVLHAVYGKPKQTILSNAVFLWAKLIIAWANLFCMGKFILHGQIYFYMGPTWANLLLHWQICLHGQFYYCIGKSIIALANLCLQGNFIMHGKFILYGHNYFALANLCLHGQIYYALANLFCMGIIILHGQYSREIIAYATKDSFQNLERNLLFQTCCFMGSW